MWRMMVCAGVALAGCASAPTPGDVTAPAKETSPAILTSPASVTGPEALNGRWVVDLSSEPGVLYTKLMELRLSPDGGVTGSFYDSDILAGRWKQDRGRTCVSFRTTDGAGPYHTAACLTPDGMTVTGQTWAEHRTFLFNWNATREQTGAGGGREPPARQP